MRILSRVVINNLDNSLSKFFMVEGYGILSYGLYDLFIFSDKNIFENK